MKTIKLITIGFFILASQANSAQIDVNVKLGKAPDWGPIYSEEHYYYLPDIESYYDLRTKQFIYFDNSNWIRVKRLPIRYQGYNLAGGQIIVMHDYHGHNPYINFEKQKEKYYNSNSVWIYQPKKNENHSEKRRGNSNRSSREKGNRNDTERNNSNKKQKNKK